MFYVMSIHEKGVNAVINGCVAQLAPLGTTVLDQLSATDLDAGTFKEIYYEIIPALRDDGSPFFALIGLYHLHSPVPTYTL